MQLLGLTFNQVSVPYISLYLNILCFFHDREYCMKLFHYYPTRTVNISVNNLLIVGRGSVQNLVQQNCQYCCQPQVSSQNCR